MTDCQNCGQPHELNESRDARFCPWCGCDMPPTEDGIAWTTLLRLGNVAEAGFLADRLDRDGIETMLKQHDEFSAVDGTWQIRHLLMVRADEAVAAAQCLKQVVESPDNEAGFLESRPRVAQSEEFSNAETPARRLSWWAWAGVVVGLLAVGGYLLERPVVEPPEPPSEDELVQALRSSGARWTRPRTEHAPALSLQFSPQEDAWVLDEDLNGDRVPERRRVFRSGRLVFDSQR